MKTSQRQVLLALALIAPCESSASNIVCEPLTEHARNDLTQYIRKLGRIPESSAVALFDAGLEAGSCYRKLVFSVEGTGGKLPFYLSPDQRFLSTELFDSHLDPIEAEGKESSRIDMLLKAYIERHQPPIMGRSDAPITIVVFSDFQCPFCRKALEILTKQLPDISAGAARIVYLHFPLPGHNWARPAAESSDCVARENFWDLQAFVFDHQSETNPANLTNRLTDYLASKGRSQEQISEFRQCAESKTHSGVAEAVALGQQLDVTGTPTIFINGHRLVGLTSVEQIRSLIPEARPGKD